VDDVRYKWTGNPCHPNHKLLDPPVPAAAEVYGPRMTVANVVSSIHRIPLTIVT